MLDDFDIFILDRLLDFLFKSVFGRLQAFFFQAPHDFVAQAIIDGAFLDLPIDDVKKMDFRTVLCRDIDGLLQCLD